MKPRIDPDNSILAALLSELLNYDIDITARELARRHPLISHPSGFTRDAERRLMVADAVKHQTHIRRLSEAPDVQKSESLTIKISSQRRKIEELERQVQVLVSGHVALISAVQIAGGTAALQRFWKTYQDMAGQLNELGAIPRPQKVVPISAQQERSTE